MAEGGWASTSRCRHQKASCWAEELLVPCCRRGPCPALVCEHKQHSAVNLTCVKRARSKSRRTRTCGPDLYKYNNDAVCLPPVVSVRVLLPLAHLHVTHRAWRAPVVLFCHPTVGARLHELLSSLRKEKTKRRLLALERCSSPAATESLVWLSLTFPHATEGVLVGLVGPHSSCYLRAPHPRLVPL